MPPVELLGFAGGFIGLSVSIPQIFRVISTRSYVGVSTTTWMIYTSMATGWLAYGLNIDSISQIITNGISALATGILSAILLRQWMNYILAGALVLLVWAAGFVLVRFGGLELATIFLSIGMTSRLPQLFTSFNSMRLARYTSVSRGTFALMLLSSLCWIAYGAIDDQPIVLWLALVTSVMSILIILFETGARRRALARTGTNLEK